MHVSICNSFKIPCARYPIPRTFISPVNYALSNVGALHNGAITIKTILDAAPFHGCNTSLHGRGIRVDPARDVIKPPRFRPWGEGIASHFIDTSLNFISLRLFALRILLASQFHPDAEMPRDKKKRGSDGEGGERGEIGEAAG